MTLLIAVLAIGSYHWILDLEFTGLDAAPLIEANRFDRGEGALALFGQEIRDGIEPGVAFYRPLTGLSHAVDYALWGLDARGHHFTQLLLQVACSVALLTLLMALNAPIAAALLAAAWFAVHPMGVEIVPCTARRAELWVGLCLMVASIGWIRREADRPLGSTLLVLAGFLAPFAKETGAVLPALLLVLAPLGRRRAALLWGLALIAPALIARTVVLGGLGGYDGFSWQFGGMLSAIGDLFDPARLGGRWSVRVVVALVFLLSGLAALRGRERNHPLYRFGLAWLVFTLLPAAFARGISPWYLYLPLIGVAILLSGLFASREFGNSVRRRAALSALAVLATIPAFIVSPMAVPYPEWFEVSRQNRAWLSALDELPEEFFEGPQLVAGLPFQVDYPDRHGVRVRAASGLTDFSLRAWTRLLLDRDSQPHNAALARIVYPTPFYSIQVSWIPSEEAVRLGAQGPAVLMLYDEEHLFERLASERGEIKISRMEAPLWRWTGKRLVRIFLPPASPLRVMPPR